MQNNVLITELVILMFLFSVALLRLNLIKCTHFQRPILMVLNAFKMQHLLNEQNQPT